MDGSLIAAGSWGWLAAAVWVRRCIAGARSLRRAPSLRSGNPPPDAPLVSILVPARDEETNISACLEGLLGQDYPRFEVIAIDDRSRDRTGELIALAARSDPRLVPERASETPAGWTGKNHALHEGARRARGEWLLFTDADTRHGPRALSSAMAHATERGLDVLSLIPRALTGSLVERVLQPAAMGYLGSWFPLDRVNDPAAPIAFANGQYLLLSRAAYDALGGHQAVREAFLEDVALARAAKKKGLKLECLRARRLVGVRMYDSLRRWHRGWRRIYLHAFDRRAGVLLAKALDLALFTVLPFALAATCLLAAPGTGGSGWPSLSWTALWALGAALPIPLIYLAAAKAHSTLGAGRIWALFHPLAALALVAVLLDAARAAATGAPTRWR